MFVVLAVAAAVFVDDMDEASEAEFWEGGINCSWL